MIDKGYSFYSQFGEDGILQYLIKILNLNNKECCELGMTGTLFSNTYNLVENYAWYGIYIEKEKNNLNNIKLGHHFNYEIKESGEFSLDNILKKTKINRNFDLLSIDIDNKDYHIWKSLKEYNPNIVIVEVNPFIDPKIEYVHNGTFFGSSFKSIVDLGNQKGYTLVCMTGNLIFVKTILLENTELEIFIKKNPIDLFLYDAIMVDKKQISFKRYFKKDKLI